MKLSSVFLGITAVAMAVVGGVMVQASLGARQNGPVALEIPQRRIAVAAADIAAGTFFQPKLMRWENFPENALRPEFLVDGKDNVETLSGSVLRDAVKAGEAIGRDRLLSPNERGFLAAVLPPGMRAVSVAVDEVSGAAGLIFPGDRVDLLLTQDVGDNVDSARRLASETVLDNVRVIAVDQRVDPTAGNGETPQGGAARIARTVTLEVTPRQAQVVTVAARLGRLTLSLRSLATVADSPAAASPEGPLWASDISSVVPRPVVPAPVPDGEPVYKPYVPTIIRGGDRAAP